MTLIHAAQAWAIIAAFLAFNLGLMTEPPKDHGTTVKWIGACALWPFTAAMLFLVVIAGIGTLIRRATRSHPGEKP